VAPVSVFALLIIQYRFIEHFIDYVLFFVFFLRILNYFDIMFYRLGKLLKIVEIEGGSTRSNFVSHFC